MLSNVKSLVLLAFAFILGGSVISAQNAVESKPEPTPAKKEKQKKEEKPAKAGSNTNAATADQVAESVVVVYSNFSGRQGM